MASKSLKKTSKTAKAVGPVPPAPRTFPSSLEKLLEELIDQVKEDAYWVDSPSDPNALSSTIAKLHDLLRRVDGELAKAQTGGGDCKSSCSTQSIPGEELQNLATWLTETCRADLSSISFTSFETISEDVLGSGKGKGNGVIAQQDVMQGEVLLKVPRKALLSARFGLAVETSLGLTQLLQQFQDNTVLELSVVVAYHKINSDKSFFAPYIGVLPEEYTIPLYWDADIFRLLHGTPTAKRAATSFRASLALYYRTLMTIQRAQAIPGFPYQSLTWSIFRWASAVVLTRQNMVPLPGGGKIAAAGSVQVQALVPGWDMINHEPGEMTTAYDMAEDCVTYPVMRAFVRGEEVTMCYGQRQNELFLLYSGFCIVDSPYDRFEMPLQMYKDDGLVKIREGLVRAAAASSDGTSVKLHGDGLVSVPVGRDADFDCLLHPLAWFSAVASALDRTEAASVMRSRLTTYKELLAAGLLSDATVLKARDVLKGALQQYLSASRAALLQLSSGASPSAALDTASQPSPPEPTIGMMSPGARATTLDACRKLVSGQIELGELAHQRLQELPAQNIARVLL